MKKKKNAFTLKTFFGIGSSDDEDAAIDGGIDLPSEDVIEFDDLIDVVRPKRKTKIGGRSKEPLLDKLLQECYRQSQFSATKPTKTLHRCIGKECGYTISNRNLPRTVKHARDCHKLPPSLRAEAKAYLADKSILRQISESTMTQAHSADTGPNMLDDTNISGSTKRKITDSYSPKQTIDSENITASKKCKISNGNSPEKPNAVTSLVDRARALSRKDRHQHLDLAIVKLVCSGGLATSLVKRESWKEVFAYADPSYRPVSREILEDQHIPREAEHVQATQNAYLRTQTNLTISCDGGTTRGRESFWTVHISTPDWKVYFIEVREATSESHTGVWIRDYIRSVSERVKQVA